MVLLLVQNCDRIELILKTSVSQRRESYETIEKTNRKSYHLNGTGGHDVYADISYKPKITLLYISGENANNDNYISMPGLLWRLNPIITNSNSSVATVEHLRGEGMAIQVTVKKTGKTTVKVSYRPYAKGAMKTYTIDITVKKYVNPFNILKIGRQGSSSFFKNGYHHFIKLPKGKARLRFKVKKGWKVLKTVMTCKKRNSKNMFFDRKSVKAGDIIDFKKYVVSSIGFEVKDLKTKNVYEYGLSPADD